MSDLLLVGISHKTAPLELRERVAMSYGNAADVLIALVASPDVAEAVALSTCNRTELYVVTENAVSAESAALTLLATGAAIAPTRLTEHIYTRRDIDVARHLFRVAAGLESMVLGEAEILGQVKRSYELALAEGTAKLISNRLFREAISAGKRARTETRISEARTSVSSVAVDVAADVHGDLAGCHVLVIGAGKQGEQTARLLAERGVRTVFVANRRYDRAIGLAQRFGGVAVRFDSLPAELDRADIVVSQTASPHPLVDHEEMALIMRNRRGRPLLVIDTAVPRDFDPGVRALDGVHLYDLDDLQGIIENNMSGRALEAQSAEAVIEQDLERFARWLESLEVVPTITGLREVAHGLVDEALDTQANRWEALGEADRERLEIMVRTLVNRLLHEPTVRLRRSARQEGGQHLVEAVRELFGLDDETGEGKPRRPEQRRTSARRS